MKHDKYALYIIILVAIVGLVALISLITPNQKELTGQAYNQGLRSIDAGWVMGDDDDDDEDDGGDGTDDDEDEGPTSCQDAYMDCLDQLTSQNYYCRCHSLEVRAACSHIEELFLCPFGAWY